MVLWLGRDGEIDNGTVGDDEHDRICGSFKNRLLLI